MQGDYEKRPCFTSRHNASLHDEHCQIKKALRSCSRPSLDQRIPVMDRASRQRGRLPCLTLFFFLIRPVLHHALNLSTMPFPEFCSLLTKQTGRWLGEAICGRFIFFSYSQLLFIRSSRPDVRPCPCRPDPRRWRSAGPCNCRTLHGQRAQSSGSARRLQERCPNPDRRLTSSRPDPRYQLPCTGSSRA